MFLPGRAAPVAADGTFAIDLPPGSHSLALIDGVTGISVSSDPRTYRVEAGEPLRVDDLATGATQITIEVTEDDAPWPDDTWRLGKPGLGQTFEPLPRALRTRMVGDDGIEVVILGPQRGLLGDLGRPPAFTRVLAQVTWRPGDPTTLSVDVEQPSDAFLLGR